MPETQGIQLFSRSSLIRFGLGEVLRKGQASGYRTPQSGQKREIFVETKVTEQGFTYGLDIAFRVERTDKIEPNTLELDVYNLSPENRAVLTQRQDITVAFEAGYRQGRTLIFSGDLTRSYVYRDGTALVTKIIAGDGGKAYREGRANLSFGRGAKVKDVLANLIRFISNDGYGIGAGTFEKIAEFRIESTGADTFAKGIVLSGRSLDLLRKLCESCGKDVSVQDGIIQITDRMQPISRNAIVLGFNSGLIEAPIKDNEGDVICKTLIMPDLFPKQVVRFKPDGKFGDPVVGDFTITKVGFDGTTLIRGQEWYANITCKEGVNG